MSLSKSLVNDVNGLHSNDQLLKAVFNIAAIGIVIVDEAGLLVEVNDRICSMFGYERHELVGKSHTVLHVEEEIDLAIQDHVDFFNGLLGNEEKEWKALTKDKQVIIVSSSANLLLQENGQRFKVKSIRDVTKERQTEQLIAASEKKYKSIFENSLQGFFLTKPDGTILEANKAACDIFGYSESELCKMGRSGIIVETETRFHEKLKERTENGTASGELTGIRKNGEQFPIEFSSFVFIDNNGEQRTSSVLTDISVRREQESKLRNSQHEMASILNNTEEIFLIVDRDYKLVNYNKAAEDRAAEILAMPLKRGESMLQWAEPNRREMLKQIYDRTLNGERIRYKHKLTKNGETATLQISYLPVFGAKGYCDRFMVSVREITIEENALTDITRKQELLQQAEAIAHVGSFELEIATNQLYWSDEVFRICGFEPGSFPVSVERWMEVIHPGDRTSSMEALKKAIDEKQDCSKPTRFVRPDGSIRQIVAKAKPILNEQGVVVRMVGVFHDVTELKEVERELAISQQKYKTLFDQHPDAVVSFDLTGKFTSVNDAALLLAETSRDQLLKSDFVQYVDKEKVGEIIDYLLNSATGKSQRFETVIVTSTNRRKSVSVILMPIYIHEEITGVFGVLKDITVEELYEKELKFQSHLLNTIQQAVIVTQLDGTIIFWNEFAEKLYGWTKYEVIGVNIMQVTPAEISIEKGKEIMARLAEGQSWSGEYLVKHKSKRSFTAQVHNSPVIDSQGKLTSIIGVSWDITKEVEARDFIKFQADLLDNVEQAVVACHLDGTIFYWNHFAENLFGFSKTEAIGMNVGMIISADAHYQARSKDLMQLLIEGKSWTGEYYMRNKLGNEFPVFTMNSPLLNQEGKVNGMIGISYDITERKLAEQELRLSEEQLNLIYNSTAGVIFLLGIEKENRFRFISMNNAGLAAIGVPADAVFGKYVNEVIPEPSLSLVLSKYNEALSTKKTVMWQETTTYPTGTKVGVVTVTPILNQEGMCIRLVGSVNDITELKKIEQSLAISQQEYKSLFDQNPDAVYSLDSKGNFVSFNPGLETLLESTREELFAAKTIDPFCHPDDREKMRHYFAKVLQGEPQSYSVLVSTLKGNGKYLSISNMPIVVNGVITGVYGIAKDSTIQKNAELQLKELFTQLKERATELEISNKELERFAYIASHDLQEPLRMVSSFLQLLQKKYNDSIDDKGREYIRFAVDGSVRMKRLINDLLDYSRVTTSKQELEKVDLQEVMKEVMQNLSLQITEKNAHISMDPLPLLHLADKTQLTQLLQNLVGNALKYAGDAPPEISIRSEERTDDWLFSVTDNGIGFDQKFAEKIFVIFQRLHNKPEYSGTGIGLAICKKIVDRHAGTIYVTSEPGKGSTFYFTISKHLVADKQTISYERS